MWCLSIALHVLTHTLWETGRTHPHFWLMNFKRSWAGTFLGLYGICRDSLVPRRNTSRKPLHRHQHRVRYSLLCTPQLSLRVQYINTSVYMRLYICMWQVLQCVCQTADSGRVVAKMPTIRLCRYATLIWDPLKATPTQCVILCRLGSEEMLHVFICIVRTCDVTTDQFNPLLIIRNSFHIIPMSL